jgi:hypothetical protein
MESERRHSDRGLWLQWVAATVGSLALAAEVVRRLFPAVFGLNTGTVVATGVVVMGLVGTAQGLVLRRFGVPLRAWMLATLAGSVIIIVIAALVSLPVQSGPGIAVEEYDSEGNFVRLWTQDEVAPGNFGSLVAIADGAAGSLTPAGGPVAVGSFGSGVHIGDFDTMFALLMAWLLGGASIGIAQWLVLRRRIRGAGAWIPATMVGKVAAGIAACMVLEFMSGMVQSLEVPLTVSIAGMGVYSGIQGAVTGVVLARGVDERTRWATDEKIRWAVRIIVLVITVSSLISWTQSVIFMKNEGFKFSVDTLFIVVPFVIALSGCIASWWRERVAGTLLIFASIAYGILLYLSALQHDFLWSVLALFLSWLMFGSVFLIAGILFFVSRWLSRKQPEPYIQTFGT